MSFPPTPDSFFEAMPIMEALEDATTDEERATAFEALVAHFQTLEPTPWQLIMQRGAEELQKANWGGAKAAFREAIEISDEDFFGLSQAWSALIALYRLIGRNEEALSAAKAASEAMRAEAGDLFLSKQLQSKAEIQLEMGDLEGARLTVQEAFKALGQEFVIVFDEIHALILRARIFARTGDLKKAKADLHVAWKKLEPRMGVSASRGTLQALALWWSAKAELRSCKGELALTAQGWGKAIEKLRLAGAPFNISQIPSASPSMKWLQEVVRVSQVDEAESTQQQPSPFTQNRLALALQRYSEALAIAGLSGVAEAKNESGAIRAAIGLPPLASTPTMSPKLD